MVFGCFFFNRERQYGFAADLRCVDMLAHEFFVEELGGIFVGLEIAYAHCHALVLAVVVVVVQLLGVGHVGRIPYLVDEIDSRVVLF